MSRFEREMLQVLRAAAMPYSPQKLDMRLMSAGSDPGLVSTRLLETLRELERAGFVTSIPGQQTGQVSYAITEAGRQHLDVRSAADAA